MLNSLDDRDPHELVGLAERPEEIGRPSRLVEHLAPDEPPDSRIGRGEPEGVPEVLGQRAALARPNGPFDAAPDDREPPRNGWREAAADGRSGLEGDAKNPGRERPTAEWGFGSWATVRRESQRSDAAHRRGAREVSRSDTSSS